MRGLFWALALTACGDKLWNDDTSSNPDDSGPADADTDTDTDTDADADADTDIDDTGGGDADTDTDTDIDCDEDFTPEVIEGPDCVTREISCGDEFQATITGGSTTASGVDYQAWFCEVVGLESYTGTERVYRFEHPGENRTATIELTSPCGELDLFAAFWDADVCPTEAHSISECEGDVSPGDGTVSLFNPDPRTYLVYVDSPVGDEANFGLKVNCN